jgi:adenylate kinase family enzyme
VRIAVVGTTGSGKTTLAKVLATQLAFPHIELDALNLAGRLARPVASRPG